jgi:sugar phosphate isomerase/epimerase
MHQVSYSTSAFREQPLGEALDQIAAAGFRSVEYSCDSHGPEDQLEPAADIKRELEARDMTATTVHGPARRNVLGAPTEEWRKEKVQVLGDALRLTGEIGAAGMVIHGIPNPMFLPDGQEIRSFYGTMVDAMRRSVEDLVPVAREAGVRILLENLPYNADLRRQGKDGDYPLIRMPDLKPFIEDFPPDQVALIVDVGHAWTDGTDPVQEIATAGDRLWATHLQDVDAKNPQDNHWAPLQGGLNWEAILTALKDVQYGGAYTFEVIMPRHGESPEQLARLTHAAAVEFGIVDA